MVENKFEHSSVYVLNSEKICDNCSGDGWVPQIKGEKTGLMKICPVCCGDGYITKNK